jgi:protein gp37
MEDRPDVSESRARLYELIERTPRLDWLLLTKRPQNFLRFLPKSWLSQPRPNVWGMTTAGVNASLWRVTDLLKAPFVVYGVSMEPLLEPMEVPLGVAWIIIGGESGPGARPCHVDWIRHLVKSAEALGVAHFVKQLGANPCDDSGPLRLQDDKGGDPAEWPEDLQVRQWPCVSPGLMTGQSDELVTQQAGVSR